MIKDAFLADWLVQGLMVFAAVAFAVVMRLSFRRSGDFGSLLLQGRLLVSSIALLLLALMPNLFSSMANQRFVMVIPAMMTLIYLVRDLVRSVSARHDDGK